MHILKYNFWFYKYFKKVVEVLENLDHALQKRLELFLDSSKMEPSAGGNVKKYQKPSSYYILYNHAFIYETRGVAT